MFQKKPQKKIINTISTYHLTYSANDDCAASTAYHNASNQE
jgi:hypothetical protein